MTEVNTINTDIISVSADQTDMCPAPVMSLLPTFTGRRITNRKEPATISGSALERPGVAIYQLILPDPFRFKSFSSAELAGLELCDDAMFLGR